MTNANGWDEVDMSAAIEEESVLRQKLDVFFEGLLSTGHSAGFLADEARRDSKADLAAWHEGRESAYLAAARRLRELLKEDLDDKKLDAQLVNGGVW